MTVTHRENVRGLTKLVLTKSDNLEALMPDKEAPKIDLCPKQAEEIKHGTYVRKPWRNENSCTTRSSRNKTTIEEMGERTKTRHKQKRF
jgi:hypothetical protein